MVIVFLVIRICDFFISSDPGNCPTGWVKYDKHCYYIKNSYYGTKKWANAKQACLDYGANLVSIHSAAEQLFLYKKLAKGAKNAWIGKLFWILSIRLLSLVERMLIQK